MAGDYARGVGCAQRRSAEGPGRWRVRGGGHGSGAKERTEGKPDLAAIVAGMGKTVELNAVLREMRALANPAARDGMARFGIDGRAALGLTVPQVRSIAR